MKKNFGLCGVLIAIVFFASSASAALHTISIMGLPDPSGIEAVNVWFDVSSDFELIGPVVNGSAIPSPKTLGWATDLEEVSGNVFKFAKSNMDGWALGIENPLLNGVIGSFDYNGSILGVNFFQFGDINGDPLSILLASHDKDQTAFVTPIPPALLLLGTGLVGLLGFRRKIKT